MGHLRTAALLIAFLSIGFAIIACGSSSDNDQLVRSLVAPTAEGQSAQTTAPQNTRPQATNTPAPTATSEIEGLVKEGTHLVGTDIQPGIYVGMADEGILNSCYWARLSNLTGSNDILANDNAQGLYYVTPLKKGSGDQVSGTGYLNSTCFSSHQP